MKVQSNFSHTSLGLFWFDLPLGILLAFIFHNIVRNALFDNLPLDLRCRFIGYKGFNWNEYFAANWHIASLSFLIGAFSHLLWDSFTHEHGTFVEVFPGLSRTVVLIFGKEIPFFKVLQHCSTLLGTLTIVVVIYRLPLNTNTAGKINVKYWIVLLAITLTLIVSRLSFGLGAVTYGNIIVTAISSMIASLILTPIALALLIKSNRNRE